MKHRHPQLHEEGCDAGWRWAANWASDKQLDSLDSLDTQYRLNGIEWTGELVLQAVLDEDEWDNRDRGSFEEHLGVDYLDGEAPAGFVAGALDYCEERAR